jgi:pimeloyl-ACP methyl ester carboxylesterase
MPHFDHADSSIYYEEHGSGFPLLLIAPGGMNSAIEWWGRAAFNPLEVYADDFRLVAMDQRNAGRSTGPLDVSDPWGSYIGDQLALMDHLGHESFHVLGCCIGCSYGLKLIERAPGRVTSAVLEQPVGIVDDNRELFHGMWREWGKELTARREDIDPETLEAFGTRMWHGEFVLSVSRELVRSCATPLLVLPGVDQFHPTEIGHEVAELAPNAEVVEPWKDTPEHIQQAVERVRRFLRQRTPGLAEVTTADR